MKSHMMYKTRFYRIWKAMKWRCNSHNNNTYNVYYKRNIHVCNEWNTFTQFKTDMYESYLLHCNLYGEKNTTIDRCDNDLGYYKLNCRWATFIIQANNRRKSDKHGINNGRSKLTENEVIEIRNKYTGNWGQITSLSNEYNISKTVINDIVKNRLWVHI